ncbi:MAG: Crp/Fnr family transcriptional regulator [Planctomycetes bacterium]|nr:Crp/Fnr family transcriptional regulator [Planctomycetota bacterium]
MNKHLMIETLRKIRFLHDIPREFIEQLSQIARLCDFDEHEVIFRENEVADHVYFVVFGNVSIEFCATDIGCKRILMVSHGEILGVAALLEQTRRGATARANETTRLVQVDAAKMIALCDGNPQLGYELMRRTALALHKRMSATQMQLLDLYRMHWPTKSLLSSETDPT